MVVVSSPSFAPKPLHDHMTIMQCHAYRFEVSPEADVPPAELLLVQVFYFKFALCPTLRSLLESVSVATATNTTARPFIFSTKGCTLTRNPISGYQLKFSANHPLLTNKIFVQHLQLHHKQVQCSQLQIMRSPATMTMACMMPTTVIRRV